MILKNFGSIVGATAFGRSSKTKADDGQLYSPTIGQPNPSKPDASGIVLHLGTGDTPATEYDYILANDVTDSLTCVSAVKNIDYDDWNNRLFSAVYTYTNETANDITIKEVGLAFYTGYTNSYLLTRTVYEEPIILKAGKTYRFTITIS